MIDVKLKYGWPVVDSTGNYAVISDDEAQFQKVLICLNVKRGSYIYDRSLGSDIYLMDKNDKNIKENAEMVLNEAVAKFEDTYVSVLEIGDRIKVKISIGDKSMEEEVLWH